MQAAATEFKEEYIRYFHDNNMKVMNKYLESLITAASEEVKKSSQTLEALELRLKVLHGHPRNRKLLETLNREVRTATETLKENFSSLILKSKVNK